MENKDLLVCLQMKLDGISTHYIGGSEDRISTGYAMCLKDLAKLMDEDSDNYGINN